MILSLLNPFTVTPAMREFRAEVRSMFGPAYPVESRVFQGFIRREAGPVVDSAARIALRLARKGLHRGAAMALAACVDLIDADCLAFTPQPKPEPTRWDALKGFMRSRWLRFIDR